MTKIALTLGAYVSKSLISEAQRCVNLFPEVNPSDSEFPTTHYLTPGLRLLSSPSPGLARLEYAASNGNFYRVVGASVYSVDVTTWAHTLLGTIATGTTPCSAADNGNVVVLVDGTAAGYAIDLVSNAFAPIVYPSFYGADRVDYIDGYFTFNKPETPYFYISLAGVTFTNLTTSTVLAGDITGGSGYTNGTYADVPLTGGSGSFARATIVITGGSVTDVTATNPGIDYTSTDVLSADRALIGGTGAGFEWSLTTAGAFNSLDIAQTTQAAGDVLTQVVAHKNIWLFKSNAVEVWYNSGLADFTFSAVPGVIIEHGCAAKYSVCAYDSSVIWLGRDRAGTAIVFKMEGYTAKRISTHCIENILNNIGDVSDAVAFMYQQDGHVFYQMSLANGDQTWVYDLATGMWHERAWTDANGIEHRHRAQSGANVGNTIVVGDWQTGTLYQYDLNTRTDNGQPIVRRRGFPHIAEDGARVFFRQFIADMDVGTTPDIPIDDEPLLFLRYSDTKGNSFGQPIGTGMGATGQHLRSIQFQRLGMGRDRVFELFWSSPLFTALSGAYCDYQRVRT